MHGFAARGAKLDTERRQRSEPKIAGGAAADAEQNRGYAGPRGYTEEFAGAERGRVPGVTLLGREQGETAARRHLDHGDGGELFDFRFAILDRKQGARGGWDIFERDETKGCFYRVATRAGDGNHSTVPPARVRMSQKPSPPSVSGQRSSCHSGCAVRSTSAASAQATGEVKASSNLSKATSTRIEWSVARGARVKRENAGTRGAFERRIPAGVVGTRATPNLCRVGSRVCLLMTR